MSKTTVTTVSVTVTLNVSDETSFREAAYAQGLKDGLHEDDASEYKDSERKSLGECAAMLIDPGLSPAGSDIVGSEWEETTE